MALYASFTCGFAAIKLTREDLRATQILLQRMETLRLANFANIQNATAIEYYDPADQAGGGGGTVYNVTLNAAPPTKNDMPAQPVYYTNNMLLVTATATWTNGNVVRSRTMQTYSARNGIEGYVYQPR
jgi:hypothetical protein